MFINTNALNLKYSCNSIYLLRLFLIGVPYMIQTLFMKGYHSCNNNVLLRIEPSWIWIYIGLFLLSRSTPFPCTSYDYVNSIKLMTFYVLMNTHVNLSRLSLIDIFIPYPMSHTSQITIYFNVRKCQKRKL